MKASVAAALAFAGLSACGGDAPAPRDTVDRYFHALAHDPIRSLTLLTPNFHRGHGLRFEQMADPPLVAGPRAPIPPSTSDAVELERARLGWLSALRKRVFALRGSRLQVEVLETEQAGDEAQLVVRVRDRGRSAATLRFRLRRSSPGAAWKVDAANVVDARDDNVITAFLASPEVGRYRRVEAAMSEGNMPGSHGSSPQRP